MLNLAQVTNETIAKAALTIAQIHKDLAAGDLSKATVDVATNLTGFNLEAPAKLLKPVLSPFRQSIGRVVIGGKATNWKNITAVTPTSGFFPAEGTKANLFTLTLVDVAATYRSFGRGGDVTWEGEIAGRNYEDARARAEALLLLQVLKEEELAILFGNRTALNSGAGPDVSLATATTGGLLPADEYFINIVALTGEGTSRASRVARPTAGTNNYDFSVTPVPTLDFSVGATATGTEASQTTTGTTSTVTLTWTAVSGAIAYAVYVGLTTGDANLKLQGIVTQSKVVMTNFNTTGAIPPTADTSVNALAFDGIVAQLLASGSGAYIKAVNGPMSTAVGRGIPEFDAMCDDIYDRTKVDPDRFLVGWPEQKAYDDKMSAVVDDRVKLNVMVSPDGNIGGAELPRFTTYKTSRGKVVTVEETPNMPGGTVLGLIDSVPYPNSEIPGAWQMHMGSDLARLDYAMTAPKAEFEVRGYGVLAGYATSLQGIIYDFHEAA